MNDNRDGVFVFCEFNAIETEMIQHLRKALELANLTHRHDSQRGTFGALYDILDAIGQGAARQHWVESGEWPAIELSEDFDEDTWYLEHLRSWERY